ncbi:MAG: SCO family protein, partial [Alphaproteobacteria bacterium]
MRVSQLAAAFCIVLLGFTASALAHHPGANLDGVMGDKEKFFQAIDQAAPGFELADFKGNPVRLS